MLFDPEAYNEGFVTNKWTKKIPKNSNLIRHNSSLLFKLHQSPPLKQKRRCPSDNVFVIIAFRPLKHIFNGHPAFISFTYFIS
jgi:hypothetical protein